MTKPCAVIRSLFELVGRKLLKSNKFIVCFAWVVLKVHLKLRRCCNFLDEKSSTCVQEVKIDKLANNLQDTRYARTHERTWQHVCTCSFFLYGRGEARESGMKEHKRDDCKVCSRSIARQSGVYCPFTSGIAASNVKGDAELMTEMCFFKGGGGDGGGTRFISDRVVAKNAALLEVIPLFDAPRHK